MPVFQVSTVNGAIVLSGIEPYKCTQPNMRMRMQQAQERSQVVGVSLQAVDPNASQAILKQCGNVTPTQLEKYLTQLSAVIDPNSHRADLRIAENT